jgi:hypothetical protein
MRACSAVAKALFVSLAAVLVLVAVAASGRSRPPPLEFAEASDVFREIHERYVGKRFTHVTFLQRTVPAEGEVKLWYEAIRPLGLVRVDEAPLEERNGLMYRSDSLYVFRDGAVTFSAGNQRWISMLTQVDIYALPVDSTLARLESLGVDLATMHESEWEGRPVVVVGAQAGDTTSAQIWYDREHLYPHRVIQPPGASQNRVEFRMSRYQFLEGGWIENRIDVLVGGRVVTTECYGDVRAHPGLPDDLYDPATFATRLWAEEAYPDVREPPECAPEEPVGS